MTGMGQYERPHSLTRALELAKAGFRPLAGGTDLFPATTDRELSAPLLDLTGVEELCAITIDRQGLRIGGAVTWAAIARADMPPALAALQQAAQNHWAEHSLEAARMLWRQNPANTPHGRD